MGWRFREESIAERTTAAALFMMAWTCSGGRLGTCGVGAGWCVLSAVILVRGLVGGCRLYGCVLNANDGGGGGEQGTE